VVHKNVSLFFIESLREPLADFNNFWHATSRKKFDTNDFSFEMQKS